MRLAAMEKTLKESAKSQIFEDISLVLLSIAVLPFSLITTILAEISCFIGLHKTPEITPALRNGRQVKALVTGVSMTKGLFLARTMFLGGCSVIGADFENKGIPASGRYSRACSKFYSLISPRGPHGKQAFFDQMLSIVKTEQIDIWISCSGVATAIEDAQIMQLLEKNTTCRCFQFNEQATMSLDDKYQFMQTTASLGLSAPQFFFLDSKQSVTNALQQAIRAKNSQYILKNVAMDDKTRGSLPLLRSDQADEMKGILDGLDVKTSKWIMQQFIPGKEEYCTQALVIDGCVKTFHSCPSESVLLHYKQVETGSVLDNEMLKFTQVYAQGLFEKYGQFTGHLSFDFLALHTVSKQGVTKTLLPIECNPRCHTAIIRFRGREKALAAAYLSILPGFELEEKVIPDPAKQPIAYYWIAHDLVDLYILPILKMVCGTVTLVQMLERHLEFWNLVLTGKDPTFEWWDPLPWFVLNHIYWPGRLVHIAFQGKRWSQINVSTGKVFEI